MDTLIIYDQTGRIITQISGSVQEPVGIPFLWVDVPEGKYLERIDVTTNPHTPVFVDLPKTEVQLLNDKIAQVEASSQAAVSAITSDTLIALEAAAELYEILQANGFMV